MVRNENRNYSLYQYKTVVAIAELSKSRSYLNVLARGTGNQADFIVPLVQLTGN